MNESLYDIDNVVFVDTVMGWGIDIMRKNQI